MTPHKNSVAYSEVSEEQVLLGRDGEPITWSDFPQGVHHLGYVVLICDQNGLVAVMHPSAYAGLL